MPFLGVFGRGRLSTVSEHRVELVRQSWGEVLGWCRQHAPVTAAAIEGPTHDQALSDAQAQTGLVWPEPLLAWLAISARVSDSFEPGVIPPGFVPLGVDDVVRSWRMLTDISARVGRADELAQWEHEPAGSNSSEFLHSWLPIASNFANAWLFVDLRPGPRVGCVGRFEDDLGFMGPPAWDDVAQLVGAVAAALREQRWVDGQGYALVPTVSQGRLRWEDADEETETYWDPKGGEVRRGSDDLPARVMMLYAQDYDDAEIADRLGITVGRVAELRDEFRRTH